MTSPIASLTNSPLIRELRERVNAAGGTSMVAGLFIHYDLSVMLYAAIALVLRASFGRGSKKSS